MDEITISKSEFYDQQKQTQIAWREGNISTTEWGLQNKKQYEHIIPRHLWKETLWNGIRKDLQDYLSAKRIQHHTGTHNLLSSWILCANLYFIIRISESFKQLMLGFLQKHICEEITGIKETELEFAFNGELSPEILLGEQGGNRGSGQTSPDVAFIVEVAGSNGIILTECKYTEHSFYDCSARRTKDSKDRTANPDPSRCMHQAKGYDYKAVCHQNQWGRKYWDFIRLSKDAKQTLKRCPAAKNGYQLFRQQALAEGIAEKGKYEFVISCVAYDENNQTLISCLKSTGIDDFRVGWGKLFEGKAGFKSFSHQQWVNWVRENDSDGKWKDWLSYINDRYGY